ncbi:hypothetical protein [Mesonia sp.]|uniref:hypothetical protein n=2 Tax=Mesonia sp. TaxID=1960830 RepID=UPI003F98C295
MINTYGFKPLDFKGEDITYYPLNEESKTASIDCTLLVQTYCEANHPRHTDGFNVGLGPCEHFQSTSVLECHLQFGGGVSASGPGGSIGGNNGGSWPGHPNPSHTGSSGTGGAGNPSPGTEATSPIYLPMKSVIRKLAPYEDEAEKDYIKQCLSNNSMLTIPLDMFLGENPTPEQETFGKEAIKAKCENSDAEVDFAYQVIVDPSFKENQCLNDVYEAMGKAPTFDGYLQAFDSDMSVANLTFGADSNFGQNPNYAGYTNAMAITNPPLTSNMINIDFNTDPSTSGNILNKPDVFKAVSLIHEVLHAEMYRKMLDAVRAAEISGNNLNWTSWTSEQFYNDFLNSLENKYFGIFDYFTRYNYGIPVGSNPNDYQHQQLAQHYRDVVKQALTEYDPSLTETQKEALSWLGLNTADIKAWQLKSPQEQQAIEDLINNIKNTFPNGCN